MVDFPNLPRCSFERPPRWDSGRRRCDVVGAINACGLDDPEECPFVRAARLREKREAEEKKRG